MPTPEQRLEYSPLCGDVTRDGVTVKVQIYRLAGVNGPWQLEVFHHEGGCTIWNDPFATDDDAFRAFVRTVVADGMRSFVENRSASETSH